MQALLAHIEATKCEKYRDSNRIHYLNRVEELKDKLASLEREWFLLDGAMWYW
jgi:hypothetical protein